MSQSTPVRTSDAAVSSFVERSVSATTRETYRRTVREFQRFLGRSVVDAGPDDVRRWRDELAKRGQRPATIVPKLSTVRSLYAYLEAGGYVVRNPASAKLVPPPELRGEKAGRALTPNDVRHMLCGPDRSTADGARNYATLLLLVRTGMRVSELCGLRVSSIRTAQGRRILEVRVKGGRDRQLPLPDDVWKAIEAYLTHSGEPRTKASPGTASEHTRRKLAHSGGHAAWLFQPSVNYRTHVHDKPLTSRQVHAIVSRYASLAGIKGKLSPHDLRRTFVTLALDQGLTPRQVAAATGHKDERMISRYDKGRENLEINALNFLSLSDSSDI